MWEKFISRLGDGATGRKWWINFLLNVFFSLYFIVLGYAIYLNLFVDMSGSTTCLDLHHGSWWWAGDGIK